MSAKQEAIAYVRREFVAQGPFMEALVKLFEACADDGKLGELYRGAFLRYRPEIRFTADGQVESGANYDFKTNVINVKVGPDPLALADMFLFESFNCVHRAEYDAVWKEFVKFPPPPMFFLDYGAEIARIEGAVVFEYLSTLREIQANQPGFVFPHTARMTLQTNAACNHPGQLINRMTYTPHDPAGCGDWRFPSPQHYAFRRMLDLKASQAETRIKYLVRQASGNAKSYAELDPKRAFMKWAIDRWPSIEGHRPTTFITICEAANVVFKDAPGIRWRPIGLTDYQCSTAMELEARRLLKVANLGPPPRLR